MGGGWKKGRESEGKHQWLTPGLLGVCGKQRACLCWRSLVHARLYAESRARHGPHPLGTYNPVGRIGTNQMGTPSAEMSRKANL